MNETRSFAAVRTPGVARTQVSTSLDRSRMQGFNCRKSLTAKDAPRSLDALFSKSFPDMEATQ